MKDVRKITKKLANIRFKNKRQNNEFKRAVKMFFAKEANGRFLRFDEETRHRIAMKYRRSYQLRLEYDILFNFKKICKIAQTFKSKREADTL